MSIPPTVTVGAAVSAAKLAASVAADAVEGSASAISHFAEVLQGEPQGESESTQASVAETRSAQETVSSAATAMQQMLASLMQELGLSSDSPMSLQLDNHGQVNVTTPSPETSSAADAATRSRLQSHINGDVRLKIQITDLLSAEQ